MAAKTNVSVEALEAKVKSLQLLVEEIKWSGNPYLDEVQCQQTAKLAHELRAFVNPPKSNGFEITMMPYATTAARLAVDLGIFKALAAQSPQTAGSLRDYTANQSGLERVDVLFITRIMRLVTWYGLVDEVEPNAYAANATTLEFGEKNSPLESLLVHIYDHYSPVLDHSVSYFSGQGYEWPTDARVGPFQSFWQTDKATYDYWLDQPPHILWRLNNFMKAVHSAPWYEWIDVPGLFRKHLQHGQDSPRAEDENTRLLFVDVGGGKGTSLLELRSKLEEAGIKGRLMLQEREEVIKEAMNANPRLALHSGAGDPGVQYIVHDFFEPQPPNSRGALYYFLRHVLHNWNDEDCVKILKQCVTGMRKGYSRLLINERIMLPMGNGFFNASQDLHMAYSHASRERTLEEFKILVEEAGLKVVEHYQAAGEGAEDVIECVQA